MAWSTLILVLSAIVACQAVLPDNFTSWQAGDKRDYVWKQIMDMKYGCPLPVSIVPDDQIFDPNFLAGSFNFTPEELPAGRPKLVGTNGNAAKITWVINANSPYTGLFEANSTWLGIMRLSTNTAVNLVNQLAMKFFADKVPSPTMHYLHDMVGWSQLNDMINYFEWPVQTQIPQPLPQDVAAGRYNQQIADTFTKCLASLPGGPLDRPGNIWSLGSVDQSAYNNKGYPPAKIYAPWNIQLLPQIVVMLSPKNDDWRVVVTNKVLPNTLMYKIQAKRTPCDDWVDLGTITTESEFVASAYHDKIMRFGQPLRQWDVGSAAPGPSCSQDPNAYPVWPQAEADQMEKEADNKGKDGLSYGNSPSVVAGAQNGTGVSTVGCPMAMMAGNGGSYYKK